jgi:hypothetical protein
MPLIRLPYVKAQTRQGDAQAKGGEDDELASKSQVII